jgi:hypothetical protein
VVLDAALDFPVLHCGKALREAAGGGGLRGATAVFRMTSLATAKLQFEAASV